MIPSVLLLGSQVILPAYFLVSLWKGPEVDRVAWLLKLLYTGTFLLFLFVAGRWDWPGYYLRWVFPVLFIVAAARSFRSGQARPCIERSGAVWWRQHVGALLSLIVFAGFLAWALRGHVHSDAPVPLTFPLHDGTYYIAQGGNSAIVNHHNPVAAQRYALDVVKLNRLGSRASGIYPTDLERYVIFRAPVHSPCDGTVVFAVDGLPNQTPPAADRENPPGNYVVIVCTGVSVLLAHLHTGSVTVEAGDTVSTGQQLGRVGNSGNTSEPHLHMHAFRSTSGEPLRGDGVPILFDGRFAIRNAIF